MEEFEALLNESFEIDTPQEGSVVKGTVIAIESGQAIIDVGYKMEGRVDIKEFANPEKRPNWPLAMRLRCSLTASKIPVVKQASAVKRRAGKKPGTVWKSRRNRRARRWRNLWPRQGWLYCRSGRRSCVPARFTGRCAPCARRGPIDGSEAAVRDFENGPSPGQHRCVTSRHSGRKPRRTARRSHWQSDRRSGCGWCGQEHHRIRCVC